jgi:hypothetical protein
MLQILVVLKGKGFIIAEHLIVKLCNLLLEWCTIIQHKKYLSETSHTKNRSNFHTAAKNDYNDWTKKIGSILPIFSSDPYGIRTRVTAVKGRCLNHLTNGPYSFKWWRRRDSNPRAAYLRPNGLANRPLQPLEYFSLYKNGSAGRIRTYDRSVNSRLLYH